MRLANETISKPDAAYFSAALASGSDVRNITADGKDCDTF